MKIILELCATCQRIETYRKSVSGIPLCIICEISLKHKKEIKKSIRKIIIPTHNIDLEKKVAQ